MTLIAYHNDPAIKAGVLAEMTMHREADNLVKGVYWNNGKGCAVGCLIKSGNHVEYETRFGISRLLARLEDGIFEGLPTAESKLWPERFLGAIRPGADLSMVFYHFMHWLLVDPEDGVIKFAKTDRTKESIQKVADLYARHIAGEKIGKRDWRAAAAAAYAAAAAAAAADAYAAAAAAADAAADAAAAADAYAAAAAAADADADAYAAAYAAAAAAAAADADAYAAAAAARQKARESARIKQADKLIELLQAA